MKVQSDKVKETCAQYASAKLQAAFEGSAIVDRTNDFPHFVRSEVTFGKLLGTGGFGSVYEVKAFEVGDEKAVSASVSSDDASDTPNHVEEKQTASRKFLATHCLRNNSHSRYAVKVLKPEIMDDAGLYIQAIMDVAIETRVLSDIMHPNIVKLRAVAQSSPLRDGPNFFLILDRLYDTLEKRIATWAKKTKKWQRNTMLWSAKKAADKLKEIEEAKLVAAFDLASAVQYLHDREIVYRDLKSENVGFDIRDDVKLFDFGLVKELTSLTPNEDGLYHLTGQTGSPAYMAPEVGREEPYNKSCDTYSFAILFWEMYSMKTPFELYTVRRLQESVWAPPHKRPFVPTDAWPTVIQDLLNQAWDKDPSLRPSMNEVAHILRTECVRLRGGDDSGLEHSSRRSTFVAVQHAAAAMTSVVGDPLNGPSDHRPSQSLAVAVA